MTKRELQKQIDELRERVRELEARPPIVFPPAHPIPAQPYTPWRRPWDTGDPLPVLPYTWC